MTNQKKILAFEYVVYQLLKWYTTRKSNTIDNDFSILKTLKLLFFVTAARSSAKAHSILLEDTFSNFVAMPYGHVESDIYNILVHSREKLKYYNIDNRRTTEKNNQTTSQIEIDPDISLEIKTEIMKSVEFLKDKNSNLVIFSPFDLVNLSHNWYSWKITFKNAKINKQRSLPISTEVIKKEYKVYSI